LSNAISTECIRAWTITLTIVVGTKVVWHISTVVALFAWINITVTADRPGV
jgi:hypothetical protein